MTLDDHRKRIDDIDDRILDLLDQRSRVVVDIARAKQEANLPIHDPERERQVLDRLASREGPFPKEAIRAVYREIMSASLALEEPVKVAFLGPEGTFSHAAARALFGLAARYLEATTFEGVFDAVSRREAQHGVVPVENSSEGSSNMALDALIYGNLLIRGEHELEVSHCLLTRVASLASIERVYSHPQPLGQCRIWLAKNLGAAQLVQVPSTILAVREALADTHGAAVAGRLASDLYGLPIVRERIQDRIDNVTRFVIVSREDAPRTGDDKTTIAFGLTDGHGRGALMRALAALDTEGVNMSRIESRPSREKPWDYVFLVDIEGHREDAPIARALDRLREHCTFVRHLGSYARARRT